MPTGFATRELQVYDPLLTQVARQFKPSGFVYDQLAPHIPVSTLSGQYPVYDERYFFADDVDNKISDRSEVPEIDLVWSTETYLCADYGLGISITPRERQQSTNPTAALRLEESKLQLLTIRQTMRRERRLAAALRSTANGGQLNQSGAATTAFATSTAIEDDWKTAKLAVYNKTGLIPNVAVIPYAKAYDMATNATLRDIFKYFVNSSGFITLDQGQGGQDDIILPRSFHGTRIVIPRGTLFHQGNPKATKNLTDVWGDSVRFLYVDENAGWGIPSTCYSFWHPTITVQGDGDSGPVVDRYHVDNPVKDVVRITECVDEKVVAPDLGFELTGV